MVKPFQIYELCQWNSFMLVQWVELHGIYQSRVMFGDSDYGENCLRILELHGIYQSRVTLGDSDYGENCLRILELHGIYQSRVTLGDSDYRENCLRILDVLLISCVTVLVHVSCYDRKLQIG